MGNVALFTHGPGTWQRETISTEPRGVLHAINPVSWDGSPRQQLLAASYAGLHRLEFAPGKWIVTRVTQGDPRPWPLCGSSEVRLGHLGVQRILVAIEPWHGNQVVVGGKKSVVTGRAAVGESAVVGQVNKRRSVRKLARTGFSGGFSVIVAQQSAHPLSTFDSAVTLNTGVTPGAVLRCHFLQDFDLLPNDPLAHRRAVGR